MEVSPVIYQVVLSRDTTPDVYCNQRDLYSLVLFVNHDTIGVVQLFTMFCLDVPKSLMYQTPSEIQTH